MSPGPPESADVPMSPRVVCNGSLPIYILWPPSATWVKKHKWSGHLPMVNRFQGFVEEIVNWLPVTLTELCNGSMNVSRRLLPGTG
jgi:hypothetical protein